MRSPSILTYEEVRACRFAGGGRGKANESFRLLVAFFIQEYVQIDGQTERHGMIDSALKRYPQKYLYLAYISS